MNTLDSVLDDVMRLSLSERIALLEILNKRLIEDRRDEISSEIKEATALFILPANFRPQLLKKLYLNYIRILG
jgi:hypothetical protein